jgi:hypothetical protein
MMAILGFLDSTSVLCDGQFLLTAYGFFTFGCFATAGLLAGDCRESPGAVERRRADCLWLLIFLATVGIFVAGWYGAFDFE